MTREIHVTPKHRRPLLATTALLAMCLLPASASSAATYAVDACQRPDGQKVSTEGWSSSSSGATYATNSCDAEGALSAYWMYNVQHGFTEFARWTFVAPSGTTVDAISGYRVSTATPREQSSTPVTVIRGGQSVLEQCGTGFSCVATDGEFAYDALDSTSVSFGVECVGPVPAPCPAGDTSIFVRRVRVDLTDNSTPIFEAALTGSLTSINSTSRFRTVEYTASDQGGGLFRHRFVVGGTEVAAEAVDDNGGRCLRYATGNGFRSPVPCKLTATRSLTLDTDALADGRRTVELQVFDATNVNKVSESWSILVDNKPPVVGEVSVSGTAREGETLRCAAAVDGQDAQVAYRWVRAAADGSGAADIAGATGVDHMITAADVGRKLQCRMAATDGGGTTTRTSALSTGPFAGDALVAPKATPVSDGSSGGASTVGLASTGANGLGGAGGVGGLGGAGIASGPFGVAVLPALPPCTRTRVTMNGTTTRVLRSYKRSGMSLSGRLTSVDGGGAVAGGVLDVMQTVTRAGLSRRTKIGSVRTRANGSFTAKVASGPTRELQLVAAGCGAVGSKVTERVRGLVEAKTTTPRVRNRQTARFSGRVRGGYVGRGVPLELQVRVGKSWRDVKAMTSNSRGEFRVNYRFLRTLVRYTYRFRVVSRGGSAWPYLPARSGEIKVRVN